MAYVSLGKENDHNVRLYFKDWGAGQPIVFSHGWPLSSDAFEDQMFFLSAKNYRCIAHDRRSHGRSSQTFDGNDMDTYADDLAKLIKHLDLKETILVGHSTGGGEIARYIGRHGTKRIAKVVLIGAVTPQMAKSEKNKDGLPIDVFDEIRKNVLKDRSQYFKDLTDPFFNGNRNNSQLTQGMRDSFWRQGMQGGLKGIYDCIKAFSETDFYEDLKTFDIPTLIIHGDDDQMVPIESSAKLSSKLIKDCQLKVYKGGSHGLCSINKDQVNADLHNFIKSKN